MSIINLILLSMPLIRYGGPSLWRTLAMAGHFSLWRPCAMAVRYRCNCFPDCNSNLGSKSSLYRILLYFTDVWSVFVEHCLVFLECRPKNYSRMVYYLQSPNQVTIQLNFWYSLFIYCTFWTLCCQLMFYTNAIMIQGGSWSLLAAAAMLCMLMILSSCFCLVWCSLKWLFCQEAA